LLLRCPLAHHSSNESRLLAHSFIVKLVKKSSVLQDPFHVKSAVAGGSSSCRINRILTFLMSDCVKSCSIPVFLLLALWVILLLRYSRLLIIGVHSEE